MQRRALGKGLAALISEQVDTGQVREIPISQVRSNPYQPRKGFDMEALGDMIGSICEYGVIQPLIVRQVADESFELIAGERRLRAAAYAGLESVPAIVRSASSQAMLEVALIENLQREDLNAVEEAQAFQRLIDEFGLTHDQVAQRVGRSRTTVTNSLRLLQLPERLLEMVRRGAISEGHGRALLSVKDPISQRLLADEVADRGLSVREVERRARTSSTADTHCKDAAEPRATSLRDDPNTQDVERRLSELFGTRVQIQGALAGGRIVIDFYGEEDLGRLLDMMGVF